MVFAFPFPAAVIFFEDDVVTFFRELIFATGAFFEEFEIDLGAILEVDFE